MTMMLTQVAFVAAAGFRLADAEEGEESGIAANDDDGEPAFAALQNVSGGNKLQLECRVQSGKRDTICLMNGNALSTYCYLIEQFKLALVIGEIA